MLKNKSKLATVLIIIGLIMWTGLRLSYRPEFPIKIALCSNDELLVVGGNLRGRLCVCDSSLNKLYDATFAGTHSGSVTGLYPSKRLPYVVVSAFDRWGNRQSELLRLNRKSAEKVDLPKGDIVCMFDDFDLNQTTLYWQTNDERTLSIKLDEDQLQLDIRVQKPNSLSDHMQACRIEGETYAWRSGSNDVYLNTNIGSEQKEQTQIERHDLREAFFYGNLEFLVKNRKFAVTEGTENSMQIDSVIEKKVSEESIFPRLNGSFIIMDTSAGVARIAETLDRGMIVVSQLGDDGHFTVTNLCLSYDLLN